MTWEKYSPFVGSTGRATIHYVPNSCIESAEYIIQCIKGKKGVFTWTKNSVCEPNVFAHFGGGLTINITAKPNFHNNVPEGLQDYGFLSLPRLGEGLICLNKTTDDLSYNMHLGAIVASSGTQALISNMMEPFSKVEMVVIETIQITQCNDFRRLTFPESQNSYALGLLKPSRI